MGLSFKKSFMFIVILLALTFSALGVTTAYADDSVPPPPATEEPAQPPPDVPVVEEPSADVPVAEEPATDAPAADVPAVDEPTADAPAVEEPSVDAPVVDAPVAPTADAPAATDSVPAPADETASVAEVLEQLPADTTLVVLDANGETLPLASNDAAQILAAPDPYFNITTGGVTTTYRFFPGATDCADRGYVANCFDNTATPIQDAIDFLVTLDSTPDDGAIYVNAGTYNENVTIDGSKWTALGDLSLISYYGPTINGTLNVFNLPNSFMLDGFFTINNKVSLSADGNIEVYNVTLNGGSNKGGLNIHSGGDVTLYNVISAFSGGNGLSVDATGDIDIYESGFGYNAQSGADLHSKTGDIYIGQDSIFADNGYGVTADASGDVIVLNSAFLENTYQGADLHSEAGSVYIESGEFALNGGIGVSAEAAGDITLTRVGNYGNADGAYLYSHTGNIYVVEYSGFSGYDGYGVIANTPSGDIMIDKVDVVSGLGNSSGMYLNGTNIFVHNSELYNQDSDIEANFSNYFEICDTTLSSGAIVGCKAYWADAEENTRSKPETIESTVPAPVVLSSDLPEITLENLPAPLPETLSDGSTFTFAGGFSAADIEIPEGRSAKISFSLPDGVDPAHLSILMFNGTEWVAITDFVILPDGTIQLTITFPGEIVFGQSG